MAPKFKMDSIKGVDILKVGNGLLNDSSKSFQNKKMNIEYLVIEHIVPNIKNQFSMNDIDQLAQLIDMNGLEQPLVVRQDNNGSYILLTGHRRLEAVKLLKRQEKWSSDSIPCVVKDLDSIDLPISDDLKETMAILSTNQMRNKTDSDKAFEIREWKKIFAELKSQGVEFLPLGTDEEGNEVVQQIKGEKTRNLVGAAMGMSPAQVGKFEKVENQGVDKLKQFLEENKISVGTAEEVASLPVKVQEKFVEKMEEEKEENEIIERADVLKYTKPVNTKVEVIKEEEAGPVEEKYTISADSFNQDIKNIKKILKNDNVVLDDKKHYTYLNILDKLEKLLSEQ